MGVRHERLTFTDEGRALDTLQELTASGPVFVGPLDMGLLRYQPGTTVFYRILSKVLFLYQEMALQKYVEHILRKIGRAHV